MNASSQINSCKDCKAGSECFKKLLPAELDFINQNKVQIEYKKGETICKSGSFDTSVFYIVKGLVKIFLEGAGDKALTLLVFKAGDYIGLTSLFEKSTYAYTATALTPVSVCSIKKESFKGLIGLNGEFSTRLVRKYCHNMHQLLMKINTMGFKHVNGKVADVLLYLNHDEFKTYNIQKILSRRDLAELAGIPVESLIRILSEFSEQGIIKAGKKDIRILSMEKLLQISRNG